MNNIYTTCDPEFSALIKRICKEKKIGLEIGTGENVTSFFSTPDEERRVNFLKYEESLDVGNRNYQKTTQGQILDALTAFIPVPNEIIIKTLPWVISIRGDKVDIGCRKNQDLAMLKQFAKDMTSLFGKHNVYGYDVIFGKTGFQVDDGEIVGWETFVSWETWEEFLVEIEKIK